MVRRSWRMGRRRWPVGWRWWPVGRRWWPVGWRLGTPLLWRWLLRGQLRQLVPRRLGRWQRRILDRPGARLPERMGSERPVRARLRLRLQLRTQLLRPGLPADLECLELFELGHGFPGE